MRKPRQIPLDQVPEIPAHASASPGGNGHVVYMTEGGRHRWRKSGDGEKLLYYIRYSENGDRQEVIYEGRTRR